MAAASKADYGTVRAAGKAVLHGFYKDARGLRAFATNRGRSGR
jgi:hypothetical protein